MSKIYKALKKAERERESQRDIPSTAKTERIRGWEEEIARRPKRANEMVSDSRPVSLLQPGSMGAEQFRKLRTYIFGPKHSSPPRTIMVTGATSGEGKTFVAAHLAAGIASDLHSYAVLVECDLRDPALAQMFGCRDSKGLSDYLMGNEKISEFLVKTEVEKLSLITGGSISENPAELIGSKRMEDLVHELKSRYNDRYVIFDSTPLLSTAESGVLSKLVDGIIIVVRAGHTPRETIKQALSSIEERKVLGFVLNDLKFRSPGLSLRYFGSDGYYYRYGYGKKKAGLRNDG